MNKYTNEIIDNFPPRSHTVINVILGLCVLGAIGAATVAYKKTKVYAVNNQERIAQAAYVYKNGLPERECDKQAIVIDYFAETIALIDNDQYMGYIVPPRKPVRVN
jgi:hypothetical protein